jgi:dephospho-CoA kinase
MIRVGITGGIGSGKTEFCRILSQFGAFVVSADEIARELMSTEPSLRDAISATFGPDSYTSDGKLNRGYLAEQAFALGKVQLLNDLVHPVVAQHIAILEESSRKTGCEVFVREAALLLDNGRPDDLDVVVWIDAPVDVRLSRASKRDNSTPDLVRQRMVKQRTLHDVSDFVDYVIHNDGSLEDLKLKAQIFFDTLQTSK